MGVRIALPLAFVLCAGGLVAAPASAPEEPKTAAEYVEIGNELVTSEKYDEAIENYTKAIKLDPKHARVRATLVTTNSARSVTSTRRSGSTRKTHRFITREADYDAIWLATNRRLKTSRQRSNLIRNSNRHSAGEAPLSLTWENTRKRSRTSPKRSAWTRKRRRGSSVGATFGRSEGSGNRRWRIATRHSHSTRTAQPHSASGRCSGRVVRRPSSATAPKRWRTRSRPVT